MGKLSKMILGGALSFLIAGGAYKSYQNKEKDNLENILNNVRNVVYTGYENQLHPTKNNYNDFIRNTLKLKGLMESKNIRSTDSYLRKKGILLTCHTVFPDSNFESCYAGKISEVRKYNGIDIYLTHNNNLDFKGIETFEFKTDKRAFISNFRNLDGRYAVAIQLEPFEKDGETINKDWLNYVENNSFFEEGNPKWDPEKQALYNILNRYGTSKRSRAYVEECLKASIAHEVAHLNDNVYDGAINRETRAYLAELQSSPQTLEHFEQLIKLKNPSNTDKIYQEVANRIFDGLMSFPEMKEHKDIYKLSSNQIKERARELYLKWYSSNN